MITEFIKGDLIKIYTEAETIVIAHGCNCFGVWETGFAKELKKVSPQAYVADTSTTKGSRLKLGNFSIAEAGRKRIFNLYIYFDYRKVGEVKIDYQAMEDALKAMNDFCMVNNIHKVYIPRLGCGNGGADWGRVISLINQNTPDVNIVVVEQ